MAPVKGYSWRIGEQVHERSLRCVGTNAIQQGGQNHVAESSALMFWQYRHVDHMEIPASVTQQAAHPDSLRCRFGNHVDCEPAAM
jgi:hypothetical protein